jgi:hypothetical protein
MTTPEPIHVPPRKQMSLFAWFAIGAVVTYVWLLMSLSNRTEGNEYQDAAVGIGTIVYAFPAAMVGLVTVVVVNIVRAFRR